jgi:ABC-2 type transport system permease protein
MNPVFLIARKDLRSYFLSPIAYVVMACFLLLVGWMFMNLYSFFVQSVGQYAALNFSLSGQKPNMSESVLRPLFGNMNVVILFVAPFITMRLIAEERKDHTVELLLTAPVRPWQVVLGKFLAGLGLLCSMVAATIVYPLVLQMVGRPDWGVICGCYLGMVLVCATNVAIGLFWSSRTENQIVSAVLTFGTLLFFWLISWAAHRAGPVWSDVLNHLSLIGHYTNFALGVIDTTDIVFYLTFTGFALFLTNLSMEAH